MYGNLAETNRWALEQADCRRQGRENVLHCEQLFIIEFGEHFSGEPLAFDE